MNTTTGQATLPDPATTLPLPRRRRGADPAADSPLRGNRQTAGSAPDSPASGRVRKRQGRAHAKNPNRKKGTKAKKARATVSPERVDPGTSDYQHGLATGAASDNSAPGKPEGHANHAPSQGKRTMNHDLDRDLNSKDGQPMDEIEVRLRTWTRGSEDDERQGLLGFVSLDYGDIVLDSLVIRRTSAGRLTISWPERRDRHGRAHPYVRPRDEVSRRRIEKAVFGAATVAEGVEW